MFTREEKGKGRTVRKKKEPTGNPWPKKHHQKTQITVFKEEIEQQKERRRKETVKTRGGKSLGVVGKIKSKLI